MSVTSKESLTRLEQIVAQSTGMNVDDIRKTSLSDLRHEIEKKHGGALMRFKSYFPIIGRGNVLRDRTISRQELERELDERLRQA